MFSVLSLEGDNVADTRSEDSDVQFSSSGSEGCWVFFMIFVDTFCLSAMLALLIIAGGNGDTFTIVGLTLGVPIGKAVLCTIYGGSLPFVKMPNGLEGLKQRFLRFDSSRPSINIDIESWHMSVFNCLTARIVTHRSRETHSSIDGVTFTSSHTNESITPTYESPSDEVMRISHVVHVEPITAAARLALINSRVVKNAIHRARSNDRHWKVTISVNTDPVGVGMYSWIPSGVNGERPWYASKWGVLILNAFFVYGFVAGIMVANNSLFSKVSKFNLVSGSSTGSGLRSAASSSNGSNLGKGKGKNPQQGRLAFAEHISNNGNGNNNNNNNNNNNSALIPSLSLLGTARDSPSSSPSIERAYPIPKMDIDNAVHKSTGPLCQAVYSGNLDRIKDILARQDPNEIEPLDVDGWSSLCLACSFGTRPVVNALLKWLPIEIIINKYNGMNAIHVSAAAVRPGFTEMIIKSPRAPLSKLLNDKADPAHGGTVLHICARRGSESSMKTILECEYFTTVAARDNDGNTAFDLIRDEAMKERLSSLFDSAALRAVGVDDNDDEGRGGKEEREREDKSNDGSGDGSNDRVENDDDDDDDDESGSTDNNNQHNHNGDSHNPPAAGGVAKVLANEPGGATGITKTSSSAIPGAVPSSPSSRTALTQLENELKKKEYARPAVIEILLRCSAFPNEPDAQGLTPLAFAARLESPDVLKVLLAAAERDDSADAGRCDSQGRTALHHAVDQGRGMCVEALVQCKKFAEHHIDTVDSLGRDTALHLAAAKGDVMSALCIMRSPHCIKSFTHENSLGHTPAMVARSCGHIHLRKTIDEKRKAKEEMVNP